MITWNAFVEKCAAIARSTVKKVKKPKERCTVSIFG
jgi:hypothetical protein